MDPRLEQAIAIADRHMVALGGFALALTLGMMTGGALKPNGLLQEPPAAQLIASYPQQGEAAPQYATLEAFPVSANRPWVAGTDYAKAMELPPIRTSAYDVAAYNDAMAAATPSEPETPSSTPSVFDRAVDAVAQEPAAEAPDA